MDYNVTYRKKDKSIQAIISYKDEMGKWRQKSKQGFKAQKDAKPWIEKTIDELEEQIELNTKIDPLLKDMKFKDLVDKYVNHKKLHRAPSTIVATKTSCKKFEYLNDMKVIEISKADIQYCVDVAVKEGLSLTTLKSYIGYVKCVFNYAINDIEIINDNPLSKVTIPSDKNEDEKIKALTKSELENLMNKINEPIYKLITMIAGTCGLRIGEIMGLTWDSIDFKNSTLTVNKQWKLIKEWEYGIGEVKRKNSNRTIPIPDNTLNELDKYKDLYPIHTSKRIFYQRINTNTISNDLSKLYKKLGYHITVHDLRHTYATQLIGNGLDFKTTAKLMGHSVEETIKTYSHVTDDMMKKATNVISNIF